MPRGMWRRRLPRLPRAGTVHVQPIGEATPAEAAAYAAGRDAIPAVRTCRWCRDPLPEAYPASAAYCSPEHSAAHRSRG